MEQFPVNTATSCKLKWIWSTLHLNSGITRSCHRTAESSLTVQNFANFHNTESKMQDRISMLQGQWPEKNCGYCKDLESTGGISDRIRHQSLPYRISPELADDPRAVAVTPTLLEVYFDNTCNLGCLYCGPKLSSFIAAENQRHGRFESHGIILENPQSHYKNFIQEFWKWFPTGFPKLARLNVLGGEPFYQAEFGTLLSMIEKYPNPDCELSIVSNLMIADRKFNDLVHQLLQLQRARKIKRIDITCSIDCWGVEQEYVRWGLDLNQWQRNFNTLLQYDSFYLNINQTISPLTIKTMPQLLQNLATWRKQHQVGHWFSEVSPGPDYLKPHILGPEPFHSDFDRILSLMPVDSEENILAHDYMSSIFDRVRQHAPNRSLINDLFVFLKEKDRRRNTDWNVVFPWLKEYEQHVV